MSSNYRTFADLGDVAGKRVLVRLDLNVPIVDGGVRDDFRIQRMLPTLQVLSKAGAKVIGLAHIESAETSSLEAVVSYVNTSVPVSFARSLKELAGKAGEMKNGDVVILENLRLLDAGEKDNSPEFASLLASFGDIYVNEAFSVSHREHASIVGIPKLLPSFAGMLFNSEVTHLSQAFDPSHPFLFVLGGAKFDTKMPLIEKFVEKADTVFVGGALANDLFKARGLEIGISMVSEKKLDLSALASHPKIAVPLDVRVDSPELVAKNANQVQPGEKIFDSGPVTTTFFENQLKTAKFVLWNGPLGDYEKGFDKGTLELGQILADSVDRGEVKAVIGGGDTIAVLAKAGLLDRFLNSKASAEGSFVSTGGGAMLDFLATETLPGIEALKNSRVS